MKLTSMANEAYFKCRWSLFRICHSCCFLSINNLSGFFLEIVMGDRWFGKNIFAFGTLLVLVLVLFQYYLNYGAKIRLFFDSLWTFAKIREDNRKKIVLSSEMTKINLPMTKLNLSVTKINLSVTKLESSVTKIRPLFLWRQGCDVKAWSQKTSFLLLKTYI